MRRSSKLVDKVRILALFLSALFALDSCGDHDARPDLEPAQIIAAADSADNALNGKLAVMRDSMYRPSLFFDTLYRYYAFARMVEVQKRIDADSLSRAAVLAIYNVKDAGVRRVGMQRLNSFLHRDSIRTVRIDSLRRALPAVMASMLDSSSLTPEEKQNIIAELSSLRRFEPEYRRELDSLTHGTVQVELELLRFMDEASKRIRFEEVLRFADANDLARYQALTSKLGELATAQQILVDRITYGVLPPEDTLATDSAAVKPSPEPRQPVQTWPDAVRML